MVQLVTRGLLLDTMRVDTSEEEIDIRVRLPERDRLLSTLETLRVQTNFGMVPLSNFITTETVSSRSRIDRIDQQRYFDVKADVRPNLEQIVDADGNVVRVVNRADTHPDDHAPGSEAFNRATDLRAEIARNDWRVVPINATERIETLTNWLQTEAELPNGVSWEWTGEQQDQQESQTFLIYAFGAALGLMFCHPADAVQQLLQLGSGAAGGDLVQCRGADWHDRDGADLLCHHDRHRDCRALRALW